MKNKRMMLGVALVGAFVACAAPFDGHQHDILDLKGKSLTVEEIGQKEWNQLKTVVSNGSLTVSKSYWMHGGLTEIGPGASMTVGPNARMTTGAGDAAIRTFRLAPKSSLRFDNVEWDMDHTHVLVPKGAEWYADVKTLTFGGAMKDNLWDISGRATLVRGINVRRAGWNPTLTVKLRPDGELLLGGPVAIDKDQKGKLEVVLEGGRLGLFWNAELAPGLVRVAPGATVEVLVEKNLDFDPSVIAVPADAKLRVTRGVTDFKVKLPPRYPVLVKYDRTGRSYWLDADACKEQLTGMRVVYPNPDAESDEKFETAATDDTLFRRRFPSGKGPWKVRVELRDKRGNVTRQTVTVARPEKPLQPPAANDHVLVGHSGYGYPDRLTEDIADQDLCNLYIGWNSLMLTIPEHYTNGQARAKLEKALKEREMWAMSIYSAYGKDAHEKANRDYSGRYLGNNIGEYASFMYQGRNECGIPMNLNLVEARDVFVNRYCGKIAFGWEQKFPYVFSTCGAALSCYELAGGIDFICNEQWAIGAMNIAHTTAEARGAARKWGPEYWCAWNAHEWQTCALPYRTEQKYDSCLIGFLSEYVMGTSMIVLESGAQGKQAWPYTADFKDQPKEERAKEGYDGYVAQHYRAVTKRFWDWVKANPRAKGTPETKIAMALGNLDAYLGQNGGFTVWSQHDRAKDDPKRWKYGAPEKTQALAEDIFFPRPKEALKPCGNSWIGGTPYGQADVMQIDDESTLADLRRYSLIVFGGWNTMTPHVKDVLERYVKQGGVLVLSRPELTTGVERDFIDYTDKDLLPLFGWLPPEGKAGEYVEKQVGKGRVYLFTARTFPAATTEGAKAYEALVRKLASEVKSSMRIVEGPADYAVFAAYGTAAYILNADGVATHDFTVELDGKKHKITLKPCEVHTLGRTGCYPPVR